MQKRTLSFLVLAFLAQVAFLGALQPLHAQAEKASYPAMAPLDAYLIADQSSEIALARSAAPASVADGAEVLVLGLKGFTTAVKGTNGFLCVVERSGARPPTIRSSGIPRFAPLYALIRRPHEPLRPSS